MILKKTAGQVHAQLLGITAQYRGLPLIPVVRCATVSPDSNPHSFGRWDTIVPDEICTGLSGTHIRSQANRDEVLQDVLSPDAFNTLAPYKKDRAYADLPWEKVLLIWIEPQDKKQ